MAFPAFFITFYGKQWLKKDKNNNSYIDKSNLWLIPLEQALIYKTMKDYRSAASILKIWDTYCQCSLVYIPKDTEIIYQLGLVAPKSIPYLNIDSLEEEQKRITNNKDCYIKQIFKKLFGLKKVFSRMVILM